MLERRSEARLMCADMVGVYWRDKSGWARQATAVLEDISPSGACLQTEVRIPPRTTLEIIHPKGQLGGSVTYCFYREIGYSVGVQFGSETKWSRRRFRPRHLLDLRRLAAQAARKAIRKSLPVQ